MSRTRMGYKTMRRLVTFGCSFTYGSGLKQRKRAWPYLVGETLLKDGTVYAKKVINKGIPGASNLEILCEILTFDFHYNDVVVIMWSLPFRDLAFTKKKWEQIGLWSKGPHLDKILASEEIDYTKKTWLYMQHADLYLQTQKVKYIHYPAAPKDLMKHQLDFIYINNLFLTRTAKIDNALDGQHPGPKSNKKQADEIVRILNDII